MLKPKQVYPISADLSALLGAAVDLDASWSEIPPEPETDHPMSRFGVYGDEAAACCREGPSGEGLTEAHGSRETDAPSLAQGVG